jgi:hypothetical protein
MKKIFLTSLIVLFPLFVLKSQWIQMGTVYSGTVTSLAANTNYIFAGSTIGGIYLSSDNGISWNSHTNGPINCFAVNSNYVFAGGNSSYDVYRSSDYGNNWNNTSFSDYPVYSLLVSGNFVYAGTYSGIFASTNNGNNFYSTQSSFRYCTYSLVANGNYIFAGTLGSGVYLTTNNGTTWISSSLNDKTVNALAVCGGNIYAGTNNGGIYISNDNGNTWNQSSLNNRTVISLVANGNNIFAGTEYYGIYLSTNNGQNWIQKNQGFAITPTVYALTIANGYIFAGTNGQNVWRRSYSEIIGIKQISISIPSEYSLQQNYPNPFNPSTIIRYELPKSEYVNICIYNSIGQKVETLVNEKQSSGIYEVTFDGTNLPSGIYFCKFETAFFKETKKMILAK